MDKICLENKPVTLVENHIVVVGVVVSGGSGGGSPLRFSMT
jgi:hypothetical protein